MWCWWFWKGQQAKYKYLFHPSTFTLLENFFIIYDKHLSMTCMCFWSSIQRNIFENDGDHKIVDILISSFLQILESYFQV